MATTYNISKKLADILREEPLLDDIEIVAINEDDPRAKFLDASRKKNGELAILWMGSSNESEGSRGFVMSHRYEARLATKPVIRPGKLGIQGLSEVIARRIHGWSPEAGRHCMYSARVTAIRNENIESFAARTVAFEILFPI